MITPGRLLCLVCLLPLVVTLFLFVDPGAWPLVVVLDGLLAVVAIIDLLTLPTKRKFHVRRELAHIATRGEKHSIVILLENLGRRGLEVLVRDDQPSGLCEDHDPITVRLEPMSRFRIHYAIYPKQRGAYAFEWIWLRAKSRLGLWTANLRFSAKDKLSVYPALKQISRYALYARLNRMSLLGVRKSRRVQADNEFERLRDYAPDDQFRSIDWRATSRRLKLTVRDYQANQSQRVVFLIDCGRMMVNESMGQSLLDAAFDAALTLGYVSLAQHDEAGLLCFSDRILRWIPPGGGKQQLNRMVQAVHDVQPELVESRFDLAFLHLQHHCRKRTLSILISNLIDDRNAGQIKAHMTNLVGRHLPMVVLLKDHDLFQAAENAPPVSEEEIQHLALPATSDPGTQANPSRKPKRPKLPPITPESAKAAAAADILLWRHEVLADLRHAGVLTLDCFPEKLTAPLVNEYLRIKSQHLL